MRPITTFEKYPPSSIAPWCCVILLVAALAIIVIDLMAIFRGIDADADVVDQNVPIQIGLSRTPGFESSKGTRRSASDSEEFGMRNALNDELLKDSANQPAIDDWLLTEPQIRPGDTDVAVCSRRTC